MRKIIVVIGLMLPMFARGENLLFSQNLSNELWTMAVIQDSDNNKDKEFSASYKYREEVMYGTIGGILAGAIGFGLGYIFPLASKDGESLKFESALILASVGAIIGLPKGVVMAGKDLGEEGSFWKTFAGTLVGAVIGYEFGCLLYNDKKGLPAPVSTCISCVFPIFSTVLTYNKWK